MKETEKRRDRPAARGKLSAFFRAFTLTLLAVLLPALLISGIRRADEATRATGFTDRAPVFDSEPDGDGGAVLTAFGLSVRVDGGVLDGIKKAAAFAARLLPKEITVLAWTLQSIPALGLLLAGG